MRLLRAREVAASIFSVDYERLWQAGIRVLLFDLDNTLGARGVARLDGDVRLLLSSLERRGFRIGILTNRKRTRDDHLAVELAHDFAVVDVARKPSRKGFAALLAQLGQSAGAAAMVGDRRFTDVLGANRSGVYSIRVKGFRR